ncbi:MAG: NYN domain-containing protein [bacterium]
MKTYAFIDVQNTSITTEKLLGFKVDLVRFYDFLRKDWGCDEVYLYTGFDKNDIELIEDLKTLKDNGCFVRAKEFCLYKNKDKRINIICPKCQNKFSNDVDMGYNKKANCDVDLTADAIGVVESGDEVFLFSGDGDFEYLVRKFVGNKTSVHIVSSAKKIRTSSSYFTSRFSTKLRKLINESGKPVNFIDINNIKFKINRA